MPGSDDRDGRASGVDRGRVSRPVDADGETRHHARADLDEVRRDPGRDRPSGVRRSSRPDDGDGGVCAHRRGIAADVQEVRRHLDRAEAGRVCGVLDGDDRAGPARGCARASWQRVRPPPRSQCDASAGARASRAPLPGRSRSAAAISTMRSGPPGEDASRRIATPLPYRSSRTPKPDRSKARDTREHRPRVTFRSVRTAGRLRDGARVVHRHRRVRPDRSGDSDAEHLSATSTAARR